MHDGSGSTKKWKIVVGCFLGTVLLWAFAVNFNIFLLPVTKEFGWGRAVFSFGNLVGTFAAAAALPVYGWAVDRFGPCKVLVPTLIVHGLALMVLSLISASKTQLFILFLIFGIGQSMTGYVAYAKLLIGWFRERQGLVLGLTLGGGTAVGLTIAPQIARLAIEHFGWRTAYLIMGLPHIFITAPAALLLLRDPPTETLAAEAAAREEAGGLTLHEALASPTLWLIIGAVMMFLIGWDGVRGHMVAMMTDRGQSVAFGAAVLSTISFAAAIGRMGEGYLLDLIRSPKVAIVVFVLALIGVSVIVWGPPGATLWGAVILGLGVGAETSMAPYLVVRYFGRKSFGRITGIIMSSAYVSSGLGPVLMGAVFDSAKSYHNALIAVCLMFVTGIGLILLLKPYRYPPPSLRRKPAAALSAAPLTPKT